MKSVLYIIPIIGIVLLSIFWVVIQMDVKFSFGAEQSEYIFNKGMEFSNRANIFILILIGLNLFILVNNYIFLKKQKSTK
jgi:hypothetical protein